MLSIAGSAAMTGQIKILENTVAQGRLVATDDILTIDLTDDEGTVSPKNARLLVELGKAEPYEAP